MIIEISPLVNETPEGNLIGWGIIPCDYDDKELDIQVNIAPIHPADFKDLSRFKGKKLTVSIPELTLQKLKSYSEAQRDMMRYSAEYASVCRQLSYAILKEMKKRKISADYSLTIDHAGQLLTMFIARIADMESYEIRRIKKKKDDGTVDLTILLPQNLYPFEGKKIVLLDEFLSTGFTLREVVKTIHAQGGEVVLVGVFKCMDAQKNLFKEAYPDIPVVTLE